MANRRSTKVTLSVAFLALAAATLSGCGSDEDPDYGQICIDEQTHLRVDDDECDDNDGGSSFVWFWYPYSAGAPAVGSRAPSSGSTVKPAVGTYAKVPASGGFGIVGKTGGVSSGGS